MTPAARHSLRFPDPAAHPPSPHPAQFVSSRNLSARGISWSASSYNVILCSLPMGLCGLQYHNSQSGRGLRSGSRANESHGWKHLRASGVFLFPAALSPRLSFPLQAEECWVEGLSVRLLRSRQVCTSSGSWARVPCASFPAALLKLPLYLCLLETLRVALSRLPLIAKTSLNSFIRLLNILTLLFFIFTMKYSCTPLPFCLYSDFTHFKTVLYSHGLL